ncbi:MAG: helix-turn-helix domain-containing protein [Candidatus Brocadiia bacterium]
MGGVRRVGVVVDLHRLGWRERQALRGVQAFAEGREDWELGLEPTAWRDAQGTWDGLVVLSAAGRVAREPPKNVPTVAVAHGSWHRRALSRVLPGLRSAGRAAAAHLLARGLTRFGFLGYKPHIEGRLLEEGFRGKVARAAGSATVLVFPRRALSVARPAGAARAALGSWPECGVEPPVGVLVGEPALARYFVGLCLGRGLRVPEDVAVVTAAGDAELVEARPGLTTVDLGYEACGRRAAELLEELMDGQGERARRELLAPGEVVARRSTDVVAWGDPLVRRALHYVADHCDEDLRVGEVARALGVSLRALQRRFRDRPRTLVQEIAWARLARARRLLAETGLEVGEVARRCGFSSGRRLARLLRKQEGMSPGGYRAVRPAERPRAPEPDLGKAKRLLATTELSIPTVAAACGFRRHRYFIDAFRRAEGVVPRTWRKRNRVPAGWDQEGRPPRGEVEITFYGPDGEPQ